MARRIVLLGIDSVSLEWLETFVGRGVMPAVERLMAQGTVSPMTSFYPVDTGTNWASIATGASPQIHGCNMQMHLPGEPLDRRVSSFPAEYLCAEPLWVTAQRAGRTAVVFDWPHSYPFESGEGLLHVGEDGRPDNAMRAVQEVRAYTTHPPQRPERLLPMQRQHLLPVSLSPVGSAGDTGWRNLPRRDGRPVLGTELPVVPGPRSRYRSAEPLWALIWPDGAAAEGEYGRVTLHATRDADAPLAAIRVGERSEWIFHTFGTDQGEVPAAFQAKLLRLSTDASEFHLYLTEIYPTAGFAHPPELAAELLEVAGPFVAQPSRQQVVIGGASDIATYFEEQVAQGAWYERAVRHVLGTRDWDVCLLKWHSLDWTNHLFAYATEPRHPLYDPAREAEAWRYWDQLFAQADRMVVAAWEAAGPDAVLAITSDHGSDAVPPEGAGYADLNGVLEREGWLVQEADGSGIDWSRTRAYAAGYYVWLNVRGREPDGIVEPGELYRRERDRLITLLLSARDASSGQPLLRTCWPIEEAATLGIGGPRTGDIFVQPWHSEAEIEESYQKARQHAGDGRYGTWDWPGVNAGSHHPGTFLVLSGPGVRAGYRRPQAAMLSAIAPTLAQLAGLPVPRDADGAVLWDAITS
jgi:predicted AlkP superfamily phosphohydrolase/phosphomutase